MFGPSIFVVNPRSTSSDEGKIQITVYEAAIYRVDGYLSEIFQALPTNTFITIFADHGMQAKLNGSGGHHGLLHKKSMIIPIMFIEK